MLLAPHGPIMKPVHSFHMARLSQAGHCWSMSHITRNQLPTLLKTWVRNTTAWTFPGSLCGHLIYCCLLGSRSRRFYSKSLLFLHCEQGVLNGLTIQQLNASQRRDLLVTWTCPWGLWDLSSGSHLLYSLWLYNNLKVILRK